MVTSPRTTNHERRRTASTESPRPPSAVARATLRVPCASPRAEAHDSRRCSRVTLARRRLLLLSCLSSRLKRRFCACWPPHRRRCACCCSRLRCCASRCSCIAARAPPQRCEPRACRSSPGGLRCRGGCTGAAAAACWTPCARARATGRSAFGAAACGVSRQLSRCALSALTAPAPRAGAVVGEHAFVHVACPALARAALAGGATKAPFYGAFTGFVGEGLFTAEGDDWRVPRSCPRRLSQLLRAQGGTLR